MRLSRTLATTVVLLSVGAAPAGAAPLPASGTLDLSEASASEASSFSAPGGAFTGRSVASIGDFDGDGRGDLAVSESQGDTGGRKDSGVVHVLLEPGTRGALESAPAVRIRGAAAGDRAGFDIAAAGDVDGDGLADLLVGAPLADQGDDAPQADGAAYLVLGRRGRAEIDLAAPDFGGTRITAPGERSWLGHAVASLPDLDGDGRMELVIGAPKRDGNGRRDAGAVHVVSGAPAGDVDLTQPPPAQRAGMRIDGPADAAPGGALAGYAVDGVGDLDGDGLAEVVVGAPQAASGAPDTKANGAAWVVFGRSTPGAVDLEQVGDRGFVIRGRASKAGEKRDGPGDWFGGAVAGLPDVGGDGTPDLAIGAHLADGPDRPRGGRVRIVPGGAAAPAPGAGLVVTGVGAGDATGMAVAPAGDLNADGLADVAIGAPLADPLSRTDAGAAYVVFGTREAAAELDLAEFGTRALRVAGATAGSTVGFSLAPAGDVSGDGGDDLAIGAPAYRVADGFGPSVPGAGGLAIAYGAAGTKDIPGAEIKADPGYQEAVAEGCTPRTNVQAVLDDDEYNDQRADPGRMRLTGVQDYVATPRNFGTVLGVTGFGSGEAGGVGTVLDPTLIDADGDARIRRRLAAGINGGDEFPGYERMFRTLADDNPAADARIMVIDGYTFRQVRRLEGLTEGAAPTYIVAIGEPPDRNRADIRQMRLVARRTGARYYQTETAPGLRRALEAIESRLRCDVEADRFQEELQAGDDELVADVELDEDAYSVDATLNWDDGEGPYEFDALEVIDEDGEVVDELDEEEIEDGEDDEPYEAATGEDGEEREVALAAAAGRRFRSLHVTGLRPGDRVRVRVRSKRRKGGGRVRTRVTQSRRRG